ncbi:GmrSD restriction endonuclease domain-containing protein [Agromyces sp. ZXT2-6]|uniref:GmrSD restriction endonuclease domain-containing protein n=1 Tax=Agromyces sp. ZXT2-6 TaxID=3461153 RepID=UPI004054A1FA
MKAVDTNLLDLLKVTSQFEVPIYQRAYAWGEAECKQLWKDIVRAGENSSLGAHFTGSVVYVEKAAGTQTSQSPNLIIDGQQRVTTVSLILAALAARLDGESGEQREPIEGFSPEEIRESYLLNRFKTDERRYRLLLSQGDREALFSVLDGTDAPRDSTSKVLVNFAYFQEKLNDSKTELAVICRGLDKLQVVDVHLQLGIDHPQLVFEAMNSTGKKLSQADLIRNFVLMDLPASEQAKLWKSYWRPMEEDFAGAGRDGVFDEFVRHYLTVVTGRIPRVHDIYDAFKDYAAGRLKHGESIDAIVVELREYSKRYNAIALGGERLSALQHAFDELTQIRADVVYPFLLEVYTDYELGVVTADELLQIVRLVISYIVRRAVTGYATNSLNTTFQTFARAIRKDRYLESVKAQFIRLQGYRAFPTDAEFEEKLKTFDAYHFKRRSYFFRSLENFGRKEPVPTDQYTIEHILPQNEDLRPEWQVDLGADWVELQGKYLHTLGNLTLTGYNSEYSDRPFAEKREMIGGFRESPLRLNQGIGQLDAWDESTIRARATRLAGEALSIWARPTLAADALATYQAPRAESERTIEDHPNLLRPARRAQFERLSEEVLAFDPVVAIEFLKIRASFKADTTFLDIIPQAARLVLVLNIPISALRDERGIARDVSQIGHWGVGDTQVPFEDNSDFSYILGLVRQAYEYQLGDGEE